MVDELRFLLLQVRDAGDPMRGHELMCFARALRCEPAHIEVADLLDGPPSPAALARADVVLLGGSGDYSVAEGGPWLEGALDAMRGLHDASKPTFASCWGFQAMARAMGGTVVTDESRAELGTHHVELTDAGRDDPVLGTLPACFRAQMGHQDIVDELPPDAVRLASTKLVANQAFRFEGRPIYCTQFHPELDRHGLLDRLRRYPAYLERIARMPLAEFTERHVHDADTAGILERFVTHVFDVAAPG